MKLGRSDSCPWPNVEPAAGLTPPGPRAPGEGATSAKTRKRGFPWRSWRLGGELGVTAAGFVAAATVAGEWSASLWTAGAPWVWSGFQSVLVGTGDLGLLTLALAGWLVPAADSAQPLLPDAAVPDEPLALSSHPTPLTRARETAAPRPPGLVASRLALGAAGLLLASVAISAVAAPAPLLSLARLVDLALGLVASLAVARRADLRRWLVVGCGVVLVAELPIVLLQELTQSTYPLRTVLLGLPAEITAATPGAFVVLGSNGLRWQRALGTFPHPNVLGGFVAITSILFLVAARPGTRAILASSPWRDPRPPASTGTGWPRWVTCGVLGVGAVELALSFSRAAWLAALVGVGVWALTGPDSLTGRARRFGPALAASAVGGIILIAAGLVGRLAPVAGEPAVTERFLLARIAVEMIRSHPLTGVGAGNFSLVEVGPPWDAAMVDPVHVVPLLVSAEAGLVAGGAWIVLVAGLALASWRRFGPSHPATRRRLAVAATLLTLASLDHYLWTLPSGRSLFWIALGIGLAE